jgi:SAM-dependent methyltransferase
MQQRQDVRTWDAHWESQASSGALDPHADTLENAIDRLKLEFMGPVLPKVGRAVEIGCGSARLLSCVGHATELELYGVDTSAAALKCAEATGAAVQRPIKAVLGDAHALPFEDGFFDLVLSGGLLEHFENPVPVLREMVRVLKPGGVFYADVVPRKFSIFRWREWKRMLASPFMAPGVYESTLGPEYYEGALTALGCTQIRVQSCGVYPTATALKWLPLTKSLDGTLVADLLGWYFLVLGVKGTPSN